MTTTGKVLLIGGGVLVLLAVICVVAFAVWFVYTARDLNKEADAKAAEGRSYGKTTDLRGCMDEGLRRAKTMRAIDITAMVANETFVERCLGNSRAVDGFCKGVPSFWSPKDNEWANGQCEEVNMSPMGTGCTVVFKAQIKYCYEHK